METQYITITTKDFEDLIDPEKAHLRALIFNLGAKRYEQHLHDAAFEFKCQQLSADIEKLKEQSK